ncbi:MAG: hypothetical protein WA324_03270 [Bryobacteraceae bacterium]
MRAILFLFLTAAMLFSQVAFKLYLKDGGYHMVREYHVLDDRIRYYSTERSDWEEIPVALVDLTKTEAVRKAVVDSVKSEQKMEDDEAKLARDQRRQIAAVPQDAGAYYIENNTAKTLVQADYKVITDKKRQVLKYLSPVPLIPGRASVVVKGTRSKFVVTEDRPQFFFRLAKVESFGLVKLTPKKDVRIVENISIIPAVNQNVEEQSEVPTFQQDVGDQLYKVWPEKPLEPGEYALVEYTQGDVQLMIWDFSYYPDSSSKN